MLKILDKNPQSISDYKAGKDRALGFLVGQAMKETRGKANPQLLNKMFLEELNKLRKENYQLKMENACLKKIQALVQQRQNQQTKKK